MKFGGKPGYSNFNYKGANFQIFDNKLKFKGGMTQQLNVTQDSQLTAGVIFGRTLQYNCRYNICSITAQACAKDLYKMTPKLKGQHIQLVVEVLTASGSCTGLVTVGPTKV